MKNADENKNKFNYDSLEKLKAEVENRKQIVGNNGTIYETQYLNKLLDVVFNNPIELGKREKILRVFTSTDGFRDNVDKLLTKKTNTNIEKNNAVWGTMLFTTNDVFNIINNKKEVKTRITDHF